MLFDEVINRRGTHCTQWDYVQDRFGTADLLPFTISDTDFAVPDVVQQALQQRLTHPIYGYTRWKHADFQRSVQKWFATRFATQLEAEWIVYSPTVIYALSTLIKLHSQAGEGILVQTPAYDAFFATIVGNQRQIVENPLDYQDGYYTINFDLLAEQLALPTTKMMLLCSPHNPTGRVWTKAELKQMIDLCQQEEVFLVSDEIHMDIVYGERQHIPILSLTHKQVALLTSGTKTFNFPGLVFAYALVPSADDRLAFQKQLKAADGLSSASILGMYATMAAYNETGPWVDGLVAYLTDNQQLVRTYLAEHIPWLRVGPQEATYLMWLDVSACPWSQAERQERLTTIGKVAIMDGSVYGGNGNDFLRLNIGCPRSKLRAGLEGIVNAFQANLS